MKAAVVFHVLASALTMCSVAIKYTAPENCEWSLRSAQGEEMSLFCGLRTFGSEFANRNFTISQSEHIFELNIRCSDVLFFQSLLEPRVFQRLYNLDTIYMDYCKLTSLPPGTFLGLDDMKRLTVRSHNSDWSAMTLELSPDSLVGMPQLEYLDLGQNNIWHLPERVFCPLPALRHLNLTWNRLQDVSEVGVAGSCGAHLVTLDLSGNDLVVLPRSGLAGLETLRELYLQYNEMSTLADGALLGLTALSVLNISSNRLVALPPHVFNESHELTELYLHNNSLSVLAPGLFSGLSQLVLLDLSHNELPSEWVSADTFRGLVRLVVLNLGHNHLMQLTHDMFLDLSALQVLDLSHNDLTIVRDLTFSSLANLHRLDLSHNQLLAVEARSLSGLHVLSSLSLSHNIISTVAEEAFDNCTNLRDIRLEHNFLKEIPKAVTGTESLRTLRISHNQLTSISEEDLAGLTFLRHLDMSNNLLRGLCNSCLTGLQDLEVLDLSRNELESVPHGVFDTNIGLQLLRMDGNKMSDINGLFASLPNLLWLNVSDNRLTWFDYALIPNQLQYLDLHNNKIGDLGNYFSLESKLELRTLDASHNHLESLTSASVPDTVQLLFVNSNRITRIAAGTFLQKHNLSMVDLYDNLLAKLDLNSINLPPVPEHRDLPEFYIGGNPIFCDCSMEWMHRVHQISGLRQHPKVMDLDKVICTLPYPRSEVNRVPFLETQASQFLCPYTSHCFALCQCCDFIACDCQMTCPLGCSCYHDETWATNIVDCSARNHHQLPDDIPMDATVVYMDSNKMPILNAHQLIGRKNMMALYLNKSRIENIQNRTFHGLSSLRELYLQDNMLVKLEGYEFEHLEHLQELYLHNNRLTVINNSTFAGLKSLEILQLSGNFLSDFPVWHLKLNKRLRVVTLGRNSWSCQCQYMVNFKNWLIHQRDTVQDADTIFCVSNSSTSPGPVVLESSFSCENFVATSIVQEKVENNFLQPVLITVCVFMVVLVMGVVFAMLKARLRTSLSKKCEEMKCFPPQPALAMEDEKNMTYDVFITYSEMDASFVTDVFASELENGDPSYKLCLASRDYQTVGTYVGDFIAQSIESSRKIVIILTKNFVDNEWCKFSFKTAHTEALKNVKNRVIVVVCGQESELDIDSDLAAIVKSATRLNYEDKSFWSKLHAALPSGADKTLQCHITETNYIMRKSLTPPLPGGQLLPNLVLSNSFQTPVASCQQEQQHHQSYFQIQPSISRSKSGEELDRTLGSVGTTAPSLSHSYTSIDYAAAARNTHVYASIDETTPALSPPTALPSVHILHHQLRQQQMGQRLHLPQQQRRLLTGVMPQHDDQSAVSGSYFI